MIGVKKLALVALGWRKRAVAAGKFPIAKPLDRVNIEILADPDFQRSVNEVEGLTLLDTARLANLWQLCRATDLTGAMLEVGSFRGGGALHLSNCCPTRTIIACDSFQSFEVIDPMLDLNFKKGEFADTQYERVSALFSSRNRPGKVFAGFFPASVSGSKLPMISFVHLDVDIYKATRESLVFLFQRGMLMDRSLIVLDDFRRSAKGVDQAVAETIEEHPDWICIPIFPGQGLMLRKSYFMG
jgi:hypothetical protein